MMREVFATIRRHEAFALAPISASSKWRKGESRFGVCKEAPGRHSVRYVMCLTPPVLVALCDEVLRLRQ